MEMAFISEEDIMQVVEGLIAALFRELLEIEVPRPFPRLTYRECMDRFGLDRPDLRFGLGLRDLTDLVQGHANFASSGRWWTRAGWSRP